MNLLRAFVLSTVLLGLTPAAHAQDDELPRGNIAGFGVFTASASESLDGGTGFGVSGTVFFSPVWGIEGGFRRQSFDVVGNDVNVVAGGALDANILTVNVVGRFAAGNVQPFVSGGVAILSSDYTTDPALAQQLAQFNFTAAESVDTTIGFNVAGGIDFQASRRLGVFVEGRFIAATADTVGGLIDDVTQTTATVAGTQEMNLFTVSGGIRIFF